MLNHNKIKTFKRSTYYIEYETILFYNNWQQNVPIGRYQIKFSHSIGERISCLVQLHEINNYNNLIGERISCIVQLH